MNAIRILLADDDMDDRFFFEKAIKKIPMVISLTTINDGEKLIAFLLKNVKSLPDILFLDLNMPRKNGSECLINIQSNQKLKKLPVVIYSTSLHEDVADVLYENGAHFYIQKPDFTDLPKVLEAVIRQITTPQCSRPLRKDFIIRLNSMA